MKDCRKKAKQSENESGMECNNPMRQVVYLSLIIFSRCTKNKQSASLVGTPANDPLSGALISASQPLLYHYLKTKARYRGYLGLKATDTFPIAAKRRIKL